MIKSIFILTRNLETLISWFAGCVVLNCVIKFYFPGVSLSTVGKSTLVVNPDLPEAQNLKSW